MIVCVAVSLIAGCATIQENESTARVAVQYATIKILDGDPEKADKVEQIAEEVKAYASGEKPVTVDALIEKAATYIPWEDLDDADTLLVTALLEEIRVRLKERLGDDFVPEDLRVTVDMVAGWVLEAARYST